MSQTKTFFALLLAMALVLAACGGGGASVQSSTVSQGQELIDLKRAYDEGVLTVEEYESAKKRILKGD